MGLLVYRMLGSWRLRRLKRTSARLGDVRVMEMHRDILRELGIRQNVDVHVSEECHVPMTWGARQPVLVLPQAALEWSDSRLESALRHEAGHISRQDYLVRWLAHLVCAAYWPNPLVWLAARALRTAQERATDDLVLRAGAPPEEYATQLFDAARTVAAHGLFARHAVTMATPSTLETRVLAIVDHRRNRRPLSRRAAALGSAGVAAALAICAAAQLQGADAKPTGKSGASATVPAGNEPAQILILTKFIEFAPKFPESDFPMPQEVTVYSD
ncbi:MAG: M56 family metallopeptidase, partial [Prosthecobacter sp.]|nr:M56 family metallopeptidase [Prosthecobacter sp.]